ncbi:MAG: serine/threonine-protein phosphatase, partial [Peptococcaceae bacterium]|nr:serine/threonine-protein phosphatase [Peptococcaceae bacterium]
MNAAGGSNIGQRKDNEDRYEIRSVEMPNGDVVQLLVIADGMGGHEHGQLASRIAVEQFAQLEADTLPAEFSLEHMRLLFQTANSRINALQEHLHDGIMGTTLTAAVVKQDQLYLGHVGDSRCYMYRDGELIQISVDHTYYAELIRRGQEISL